MQLFNMLVQSPERLDFESLLCSRSESDVEIGTGNYINKELYYARLFNYKRENVEPMFTFVGTDESMANCLLNTFVGGVFDENSMPKKFRTTVGQHTYSEPQHKNQKNTIKYTLERVFGLEDYANDTVFGNPLKRTDYLVVVINPYDHDLTYLRRIEQKMRFMNKRALLIVVAVNCAQVASKYPALEEHKKFFSSPREEIPLQDIKTVLTELNVLAYIKMKMGQSIVTEVNRLFGYLLRLGCGLAVNKDILGKEVEAAKVITCRKISVTIEKCENISPINETELCDPIVTINMKQEGKKFAKKTKVVKKSINPVFNETFEMNVIDLADEIEIEVAHNEKKVIAMGVIPLMGLVLGKGSSETLTVDLDSGGTITVTIASLNFGLSDNDMVEIKI